GALAPRRAVHPPVAALAARRPMVEPTDTDLPGRTSFAERGPDSPFCGAPHVALLRNTRGPRGQPPAARQSPGRPRTGRGPSYLAHQHRALSALDGRRAGLRLARDARNRRAARIDTGQHGPLRALPGPLLQLVRDARPPASPAEWAARLRHLATLADTLVDVARTFAAERGDGDDAAVLVWTRATHAAIQSHLRDVDANVPSSAAGRALGRRLSDIRRLCREMSEAMEFGFLFDPARKIFSIGYRATDGSLDPAAYDLLASE